ncbi:hypothetical protein BDN72DRAFT_156122 [Pluteus cervinus]|uniref:Uncharacterized protein n=1 Tax=Pluteus cervinus TaxID=181527 RepID=A0ACD3AKW2_9AGAR|nr:hypothetical protein BDN72DRAFT_156122 [Pluteus cervinus]
MDDSLPFNNVLEGETLIEPRASPSHIQSRKPTYKIERDWLLVLPFFRAGIEFGTPPKPKPRVDPSYFRHSEYDCDINHTFNFVKAFVMLDLRQNRRRDVKSFPVIKDFPSEILFEIFGHLHPVDLYHLGFVSQGLRRMIRSKSSFPLWRLVWQRNPDIAECPPNISYLRWADLLFGEAICESCERCIAQPDFTFMFRYCSKCFSDAFFPEEYDLDLQVKLLVPGTLRTMGYELEGNRYPGQESNWCHRRTVDILTVQQALREFEDAWNAGIPDTQEQSTTFCTDRLNQVQDILKRVPRYERWLRRMYRQFWEQKSAQRRRLFWRIKKKLHRLGYSRRQMTYYLFDKAVLILWKSQQVLRVNRGLIRQTWSIILKVADHCQEIGRQSERLRLISDREDLFRQAYIRYRGQYPASKWCTFPSFGEIFILGERLINDPNNTLPTPEQCDTILQSHSQFIESWFNEKMVSIFQQFVDPRSLLSPARFMNLATFVFRCELCMEDWHRLPDNTNLGACMFGWTDLARHLGYHQGDVKLHQVPVVRKILFELELDPETTSADELDRLNHRFVCRALRCKVTPTGYRREIGSLCFSWRTLVRHVLLDHKDSDIPDGSATGDWCLLGPEATEYVIRREEPNIYYWDYTWACNRCSRHAGNPVSRLVAVEHVQKVHKKRAIVNGRDVVHIPGNTNTLARPFPVGIPVEPHNHICMVCPQNVSRFYDIRAVTTHLHDKHGIQQSQENIHRKEIPIIFD